MLEWLKVKRKRGSKSKRTLNVRSEKPAENYESNQN